MQNLYSDIKGPCLSSRFSSLSLVGLRLWEERPAFSQESESGVFTCPRWCGQIGERLLPAVLLVMPSWWRVVKALWVMPRRMAIRKKSRPSLRHCLNHKLVTHEHQFLSLWRETEELGSTTGWRCDRNETDVPSSGVSVCSNSLKRKITKMPFLTRQARGAACEAIYCSTICKGKLS